MNQHKPVTDYPAYQADRDGNVWSRFVSGPGSHLGNKWTKLRPKLAKTGYLSVVLYNKTGKKEFLVHQVILTTFTGPCPEGMECRHLDGNPQNNNIDNLCWGTAIENHADRRRHGTSNRNKTYNNKLTFQQVQEIRELHAAGKYVYRELAKIYGISEWAIGDIVRKESYKLI